MIVLGLAVRNHRHGFIVLAFSEHSFFLGGKVYLGLDWTDEAPPRSSSRRLPQSGVKPHAVQRSFRFGGNSRAIIGEN